MSELWPWNKPMTEFKEFNEDFNWGMYEVSSLGRVWSIRRYDWVMRGNTHHYRITGGNEIQQWDGLDGKTRVRLTDNRGKRKVWLVEDLVRLTWGEEAMEAYRKWIKTK